MLIRLPYTPVSEKFIKRCAVFWFMPFVIIFIIVRIYIILNLLSSILINFQPDADAHKAQIYGILMGGWVFVLVFDTRGRGVVSLMGLWTISG